jgi:2,4-dienoyl-CoA reductase-like NADH-dependent reductase (Old Yellow Enzyme family)
MPSLFDPIQLGAIRAPNRILMAPLTRGRATREHAPTPLMAQYYAQRASAGLIFTEATGISRQGLGWPHAPGLWTEEQVEGWRTVVDSVHAANGRIAAQLWHMGRLVHPSFLGGEAPVSASATTAPGNARTHEGKQPYAAARPLRTDEIPALIETYRVAARNAMRAGFDGVEIHAANGYLIDQFLRDNSNFRDDAYGGAIANRIRLLLEIAEAVVGAVGADRTGVRLSPNGNSQGADDSDPHTLFAAAAAGLSRIGIAYLELREPGPDSTFGKPEVAPVAPTIRAAFAGPLILNSDYDDVSGQKALDEGRADAITFGRRFLANPDLPRRFAEHIPLNKDVVATWYANGPEGYVDYPAAGTR